LNDPVNLNKRSYIFHSKDRKEWNKDQYLKFLQGLKLYIDIPINNRKIGLYIGPDIDANHVKHVKGPYLRSIRKRARL